MTLASVMAFASTSFAANKKLICQTGDIMDMDLQIESLKNGNEKVSVILMSMDGVTVTTYVNSKVKNNSVTKDLEAGKEVSLIVSQSDLEDTFGGAFLDAGIVSIFFNNVSGKYDVQMAAKDLVILAECAE